MKKREQANKETKTEEFKDLRAEARKGVFTRFDELSPGLEYRVIRTTRKIKMPELNKVEPTRVLQERVEHEEMGEPGVPFNDQEIVEVDKDGIPKNPDVRKLVEEGLIELDLLIE